MADDIVTRLRQRTLTHPDRTMTVDELCWSAAAEIERLQAIVAAIDDLPERELYDGYDDYHIGYNAALQDVRRALHPKENNDE